MNLDQYREMKAQEAAQPIETEVVENVQVEQTPIDSTAQGITQTEQVSEQPPIDGVEASVGQTESPVETNVFDLGGKQYSATEIEEAVTTRANLLQEQARIEQERQQLGLQKQYYDAIQGNPEFAQKFAQTFDLPYMTPEQQKIKELNDNYNQLLVKTELNELRANYGDVDERAVIQFAVERNLSRLEDAYNLMQVEKQQYNPRSESVDVDALKEQIRQELERELQSKVDTSTIIDTRGSSREVVNNAPTLTQQELKVARNLKMTPTEYAKWRSVK